MSPSDQGGDDRRRWPRVAIEASVSLSSPSVEELVSGPLHDISMGGLFIRSRVTKPEGTELQLRIIVGADGTELRARGIVVREVTLQEALASGRPPGMGLIFTELDDASRSVLERLLEAAIAAGLELG